MNAARIERNIAKNYLYTFLSGTRLSEAMSFSVMMIALFPAVGAIADRAGFTTAFTVIFAASVPVLLLSRGLLLGRIRRDRVPGPSG